MPEISQEHIDDPGAKIGPENRARTPDEKAEVYLKAFDMFMNDPRKLTIIQIARELRLEPASLTRYAQNKGWEQMRLQQSNIVTTVQNEKRLAIAKSVDERIVQTANDAIAKASDTYMEILDRIKEMPVDPYQVPDDELDKDDHGNIKKRPKRAKLLEEKVFLLNQTMEGFMKMANGAQGIGLVLSKGTMDPKSTASDLNNLTKLNVLLLNIQKGKGESALKHVTDIDAKPAEGGND